MVGPNWPNGGEIDIIEGANDIAPNLVTIHTTPGCTMEGMTNRTQTGRVKANDCVSSGTLAVVDIGTDLVTERLCQRQRRLRCQRRCVIIIINLSSQI